MTKPLMGRQSFIQGLEIFHQAQRVDQSVIFSKSTGTIRRTTLFERASDWLENLLKGDQHKTQWREFNALHAKVHLIKQLNDEISMHISDPEATVQHSSIAHKINMVSENIVDVLLSSSFINSEESLAAALKIPKELLGTPIEVALRHIKAINKNALSNPVQFEFIKLEINNQIEKYNREMSDKEALAIPVTISSIISTDLHPTTSANSLPNFTEVKLLQDASYVAKLGGVFPRVALDIAKLMERDELNSTPTHPLTQEKKYLIAGEVYAQAERYLRRSHSKNKTENIQTTSLSIATLIKKELVDQRKKTISQRSKFWGLNSAYKKQAKGEIEVENSRRAAMEIKKLPAKDELAIIDNNRDQQNNIRPVVADRVRKKRS